MGAILLTACSQGVPVAATHVESAARQIVAAPELGDQPSFANRTGQIPALTLQGLFHPTYVVPADSSEVRTLLVTGDVIPARGVNYYATVKRDFLWPFRRTADFTKNADIIYINLEAPLFAGCPVSAAESFTFCGDARFADGLTLMGTKVANLTNNHITNYGAEGVNATVTLQQQHGIQTSGLGPVAVVDVRGIKFGFIGFNGVGRSIDKTALREGIARARQQADVVVVQFHWGKEYERQPMSGGRVAPDDPVTVGHETIDWGADIVMQPPALVPGGGGLSRQAHHLCARQLRLRPDVVGGDARGSHRHVHLRGDSTGCSVMETHTHLRLRPAGVHESSRLGRCAADDGGGKRRAGDSSSRTYDKTNSCLPSFPRLCTRTPARLDPREIRGCAVISRGPLLFVKIRAHN